VQIEEKDAQKQMGGGPKSTGETKGKTTWLNTYSMGACTLNKEEGSGWFAALEKTGLGAEK